MAEENVPAPTRTNEQLVPVKQCLPIGKINLLMDLLKMQKNPIFHISVDILQNTNFFRAFTTSADVPSIYVQQFWNTLAKDTKTSVYSFQLDELWFNLNADLFRNALGITPKDYTHPFMPPPACDLVIDFVNNLGYLEELQFVSKMGRHNIHRRPQSPIHITADDYPLNNLKFVSKGGVDEVFGMPIPKDLITDSIRNSDYYKKYMEMATCKPRQPTTMTGEEVETKKKAPKDGKSTQPAPAKQPKPAKKKTSKPTPSKKIRKRKRYNHLVNEEDEKGQPASEPQVENNEYNLQRGIQMSLESLQAQGQVRQAPVYGVAIHEPDSAITRILLDVEGKGKDDTSVNVVHDILSPADSTNDAETAADMEQSNIKMDTEILNVVE
ncbi:hypothetical protein Tco_0750802 [Tanacetum coccineum]|uniref:Histone deacetylase 14 n=1 Tax=Tanacetum coccineum TaxID=301880 RepID=A0ABQ4Z3D2_9ASTR